MRIILWDIDGTLIKSAGAGAKALGRAVSGFPHMAAALPGIRLDGMTDYKIARILCAARRHAAAPHIPLDAHAKDVHREEMDTLLGQYLDVLDDALQASTAFEVLPGVVETLNAMDARGGVMHALGTGNLERGARLKLSRGKLWERFVFGGYGSDAEERPDVLRAAWRRAETHLGTPLTADTFVVVGDTPKDVDAAHAVGLACVGVATGRFGVDELRAAGANDVLEHLQVPDAVDRILAARRTA